MTPVLAFVSLLILVGVLFTIEDALRPQPPGGPVMPDAPTLSPQAQQMLQQAFNDEATALQLDQGVAQDQQAVQQAQQTLNTSVAQQSTAHTQATASAMAALKQIAQELGVQLPQAPPPPQQAMRRVGR